MVNKRIPLPANIALTDRSKKFYDSTYTLVSNGFKDEKGVYRDFDCFDPEARAPTPLPPMLIGDDEFDMEEFHTTRSNSTSERNTTPSRARPGQITMHSASLLQEQVHTPLRKSVTSKVLSPSSPSDLSDCPSDISDWEVAKLGANWGAAVVTLNEPKRKSTTRGVAQKVKKGAKKLESANPPSKLLSPQTDSHMRVEPTGPRRRSIRQANALGGK